MRLSQSNTMDEHCSIAIDSCCVPSKPADNDLDQSHQDCTTMTVPRIRLTRITTASLPLAEVAMSCAKMCSARQGKPQGTIPVAGKGCSSQHRSFSDRLVLQHSSASASASQLGVR
jgi:hypothetical protein